MRGQTLPNTLYLYVRTQRDSVNQHNSVLIQHIVIDHLAPKVTVGNHLHFEPRWTGRNTEPPTAGSALARQTHSHQTHSQRHSTRYRDGDREEKKQKRNGEGVTEMH